ncbi:MAG TPA: hypothetical protein VFI11_08750 [Anaerolineales bacterium]|nr:hypothetical protein [Anaerolineales bacterium]
MRLFQLQRLSAVALVIFLTLHMIVLHYPPFHVDFSRVIDRMAQPIWKAIDIAFLLAVLVHALAGSYAVLTDLQVVSRLRKGLAWTAIVVGLVGFVYGAMTILAFQRPS